MLKLIFCLQMAATWIAPGSIPCEILPCESQIAFPMLLHFGAGEGASAVQVLVEFLPSDVAKLVASLAVSTRPLLPFGNCFGPAPTTWSQASLVFSVSHKVWSMSLQTDNPDCECFMRYKGELHTRVTEIAAHERFGVEVSGNSPCLVTLQLSG